MLRGEGGVDGACSGCCTVLFEGFVGQQSCESLRHNAAHNHSYTRADGRTLYCQEEGDEGVKQEGTVRVSGCGLAGNTNPPAQRGEVRWCSVDKVAGCCGGLHALCLRLLCFWFLCAWLAAVRNVVNCSRGSLASLLTPTGAMFQHVHGTCCLHWTVDATIPKSFLPIQLFVLGCAQQCWHFTLLAINPIDP